MKAGRLRGKFRREGRSGGDIAFLNREPDWREGGEQDGREGQTEEIGEIRS